jgi:hypothetical protein
MSPSRRLAGCDGRRARFRESGICMRSFFSALRFLVAVLSNLSCWSCVLKVPVSELLRRPWCSRSLVRFIFLIADLTLGYQRLIAKSLEAALVAKN